MRRFDELHPVPVLVLLCAVMGLALLGSDPAYSLLALLGGAAAVLWRERCARGLLFPALVGAGTAVLNPLLVHRGITVLFTLRGRPITREAALYGITMGLTLCATLLWARLFSQMLTGDRLLYLFGTVSPRFGLLVSMGLRFVPLLLRDARHIREAQTSLGLLSGKGVLARARGELRVLAALLTRALENGILTADSMAARGYGTGRRSRFSPFRFAPRDVAVLLCTLLLAVLPLSALFAGGAGWQFYPVLHTASGALRPAALASLGLLSFFPILYDGKEALSCRRLLSKI